MHDRIHRQRQVELARPFGDLDLLVVRVLEARDPVGDDGLIALEADLHMAKSGIGQRESFSRVNSTADVIRLEYSPTSLACCTSSTRSLRAVGSPPEKWICSTPISASSLKTFFHSFGREFVAAALELDRIGAIGTLQRTAMRQLGETASGIPKVSAVEPRCSSTASPSEGSLAAAAASVSVGLTTSSPALRSKILVGQILQHGDNVTGDGGAFGGVFRGELVDDSVEAAGAVAKLQHFDRDLVRRQHTFGARITQRCRSRQTSAWRAAAEPAGLPR